MRAKPKTGPGKKKREDGVKQSQKLLLTWMIEEPHLFPIIQKYVAPADFTEGVYRKAAEALYGQFEKEGEVNPAKIVSMFGQEEEQKEIAALFHTHFHAVKTKDEKEKALKETLVKVRQNGIDYRLSHLSPTDMAGLQQLVLDKRQLEQLEKLHISIE